MDGAPGNVTSPESEWERTFDAVPDLIAILDPQHRVLRVNRAFAERLGRRPEEVVGMMCYELVHGAQAPPVLCPHARLLDDGQEHVAEIHDERLAGTFLVSVSPLRDARGELSGSVHVARDITHQKRAEAEARKAVAQRDTFLALLSHELRNPLGAILNAAYVVKRGTARQGSFHDALAVIERQATQMSRLLDDLLDISRVMQGKIEMRTEVVDIAEVVQNAANVVRSSCLDRHQVLDVEIHSKAVAVQGDPVRLQQILVNLLANASKYTPTGGWICMTTNSDGQEVVVRVRDNGRGIPREKLASIFELFVQAEECFDRQEGGMGVGLTLVKMLAEMHGGSVSAHSDGAGRGSEFVVRLPRLQVASDPTVAIPATAATSVAARVLIVEDNPDSRNMLQALLELDGHDVSVAEDGLHGFESLATSDFDLALIDIGLPGLDGYEIVRRFRSLQRARSPRLIALTGYGRPADRQAVLEAGFDEHIVKPCRPQDLERILQSAR
jgi:two-component system CheB/CheR fusion protein